MNGDPFLSESNHASPEVSPGDLQWWPEIYRSILIVNISDNLNITLLIYKEESKLAVVSSKPLMILSMKRF